MAVLGLDVSTSCTGWCIMNSSGKVMDIGAIELQKIKCVYEKSTAVEKALLQLMINHDIGFVYIEENLQSFRRGLSSAQTLSTLARFNGIVSLLCYKTIGLKPKHVNVNAARKSLGIKIISKRKGGAPTKEQVLSWVDSQLSPDHDFWPKKTLKSGPRKNQTILDPSSFDMADAYVVARHGLILNNVQK